MIDFPFRIEDGRVALAQNDIESRVKRIINYSTIDVPYQTGVGSGINDIVFSVGAGGNVWKFIEDNIVIALRKVKGIDRVDVSFQKVGERLLVDVYYYYYGTGLSYRHEVEGR